MVYGGDAGEAPNLPGSVYNENATSHALSLATSGGTIILRNQNGNIVDRVVYAAGDLSTNGSLTRFPNLNGAFVPQPYVSVNLNTPGLQYDGSLWNQHFKVPAGVPNVGIGVVNGQVLFNFTRRHQPSQHVVGCQHCHRAVPSDHWPAIPGNIRRVHQPGFDCAAVLLHFHAIAGCGSAFDKGAPVQAGRLLNFRMNLKIIRR